MKLFLILGISLVVAEETERNLESLPTPGITDDQIRKGGLLLYILGIFYVFFSIREVCTEFFLPSIDYIIEKYNIKPEVAGATILAMGGSAPEIFIMFFGTFLAESNIGYSTILGSGAINGMLLVGICGLCTKSITDLQWWVVVRDSIINIVLLGFLILFTYNLQVAWYEGLVLLIFYFMYAIFMYYNPIIERTSKKYLNLPYDGDDIEYHPLPEKSFAIRRHSVSDLSEFIPPSLNFKKGVLAKMMRNAQSQIVKSHSEKLMELKAKLKHVIYVILQSIEEKKRCSKQFRLDRGVIKKFGNEDGVVSARTHEMQSRIRKLESLKTEEPMSQPQVVGYGPRSSLLKRYLLMPLIFLMKITVPNIKKYPNLWLASFLNSMIWIGFLSFLLVWWVLDVGKALFIPQGVLGIIILGAGVSIPDLVNTLLKVLEGSGEMAISGCLGSNIINLSFGVGLPWFLYGVIYGNELKIESGTFNAQIVLICTLAVSYIFIGGFKWQLSKNLGVVMIFFYLIFILLYLLFEFSQI